MTIYRSFENNPDAIVLDKRQQAAAGGGVAAAIPTATATKQTLVYAVTTVAGIVQTIQVPYSQVFTGIMTDAAVVSAGVIGMPTGALATASASGVGGLHDNFGSVIPYIIAMFIALSLGLVL